MRKVVALILISFVCFVVTYGARPEILQILYQHSSLGDALLAGDVDSPPYNQFKIRISYYLADSLGWNIELFDYRSNSNYTITTSGWRSAEIDTSQGAGYWLGIYPPFHFAMTTWNMSFSHIETFWTQSLDTTTDKGRVLLEYIVPDSSQDPDVPYDTTDYNIYWFETAYFQWDEMADSATFAACQAYSQTFKDSAAANSDLIFILGLGNALTRASVYGNDSTDNWESYRFNVWARDTLMDLNSVSNFYVFSNFLWTCFHDSAGDIGTLDTLYWGSDSTDSHPNYAGGQILQDSAYYYLADVIRAAYDYWDPPVISRRVDRGRIR